MNFPPSCPSRELFEHSLESTCRALAGEPGLQIDFSGLANGQIAAVRGLCDAIAMKFRYHNADLHRSMAPAGPLSRAIYDEFENLRIEAVASEAMSGVAANLAAAFEHRRLLRGLDLLDSDAATPLANAAVLLVRARLVATPLAPPAARFVARWKDEIIALTGNETANKLDGLWAACRDQEEFARQSSHLIDSLELLDEPEKSSQAKPAETPPDSEEGEPGIDQAGGESSHGDSEGQEGSGTGPVQAGEDDQQESAGHDDSEPEAGASSSVIPFPREGERDPVAPATDAMEGSPEEPALANKHAARGSAYHAYTTRYDEVIRAADMAGKDQVLKLRARLDREISEHRRVAVRLASRLQRSLATLQKRAWTFDLDDGLLDTSRLSRLVVDPSSPLAYKQERDSEVRDTVVSFLIDNSGSMRGRPIALAAMFADILAQALERCHVGTEILGFTTRQWRGGQTRRTWSANGKPGDPGRLSDLRHIIYKEADEPWRRARQALGVMLWPELLKENIDGEALLWAHRRLGGRSEQRRILVVISDGVPADDATLTANADDYLDAHLRQVIEWIENKSSVELLAIGIGHDVSTFYSRSVTIADSEQLGDAMAHELVELLGNVPSAARHPFAITP
jgi:cobaltochelatase CobT